MFNELELLSYNINQYKKSKNPIKKLIGRYLYRRVKKEASNIKKSVLDIDFLNEFAGFISTYKNSICILQDLNNETIIKIDFNNKKVDIRIKKSYELKERITLVYYIDGVINGGILKGRKIEKLYTNKIDRDGALHFDEYSKEIEQIIRDTIDYLIQAYIHI